MAQDTNYTPTSPGTIAGNQPCLPCFKSERDKWAGLVYLLALLSNQASPSSPDALAATCACFNCVPDDELLTQAFQVLTQYATDAGLLTEGFVTSPLGCFQCVDELTLKRQALCLLSAWLTALLNPTPT